MEFIRIYLFHIIVTAIIIVLYFISRIIVFRLVKRFARLSEIIEHRANLVSKYINILIGFLVLVALFLIWGVKAENVLLTFSSIFAVIGVAMFAQWSILSNVTAGITLFFSAPYKIGDTIRIHDKDFPIEAEIEDIRAFHTHLRTESGEYILYPNNLLLQKGVSIVDKKTEAREFTD